MDNFSSTDKIPNQQRTKQLICGQYDSHVPDNNLTFSPRVIADVQALLPSLLSTYISLWPILPCILDDSAYIFVKRPLYIIWGIGREKQWAIIIDCFIFVSIERKLSVALKEDFRFCQVRLFLSLLANGSTTTTAPTWGRFQFHLAGYFSLLNLDCLIVCFS